jgi:hypothetical protein
METQEIKWVELTNLRKKGTKLNDFEFSIYRNIVGKSTNKGNYLSFSDFFSQLYKDNKVKVGLIGERVVFKFNKEEGLELKLNRLKMSKYNYLDTRIASVQLVDLIFEKCGYNKDVNRNLYNFIDIGNNTFMITRKL